MMLTTLLFAITYSPMLNCDSAMPFGSERRLYEAGTTAQQLEDLRARFGVRKRIPPEYELAALTALSHYPQLADARIDFVVRRSGAPISSMPVLGTLFMPKRYWRFRINILENDHWGDSPALVKNMSFNAAVGALGHELSHTASYAEKNFFQMFGLGVSFLSRRFHKAFEKNTDKRAIAHGLGWQLYDWASELRGGRLEENPDSWLDRYYLAPALIEREIHERHGTSNPAAR